MSRSQKAQIAFVGDLVPTSPVPEQLPEQTARVFGLLHGADLGFGDLEIPLSKRGHQQEKFIAFDGFPEMATEIPKFGVDLISLATNHAMDRGADAMQDTIVALEGVGIESIGAGENLERAERLAVREVGGIRVGFLAWTCLTPPGSVAAASRPGLASIHVHTAYEVNPNLQMEEPGNPPLVRTRAERDDLDRVSAVIREARESVDFLVISMHWGFGSTGELAEYQPEVGRALIDAGADIVIGAHVHAVQAVERYRDRIIAYGIGNFVAQQPRDGLSQAAIELLDDMSKDAAVAVLDIYEGEYELTLTPVMAGESGLPEIPAEHDGQRIATILQRSSAERHTDVTVNEDGTVGVRAAWGRRGAESGNGSEGGPRP